MVTVTKAKVMQKLKADGAKWEWESSDVFSAWLPDGKAWAGHNVGIVTQELMPGESMMNFWNDVYAVIMHDVVDQEEIRR